MKKKSILPLVIITLFVITIVILNSNKETAFLKLINYAQKGLIINMENNKPVILKAKELDKLFEETNSDKIVLFIPSRYSIEKRNSIIKLVSKNFNKNLWILTNNKDTTDIDLNSSNNAINCPGLTFQSEIGPESALLFSYNEKREMKNVLFDKEISDESIKTFENKNLN